MNEPETASERAPEDDPRARFRERVDAALDAAEAGPFDPAALMHAVHQAVLDRQQEIGEARTRLMFPAKPPRPQLALDDVMSGLEQTVAAKIEAHPTRKQAAAAREALAPTAEQAQAILGELQLIQTKHGAMVSKLVNLNLSALERQMVPLTGEGARLLSHLSSLAQGTHQHFYTALAALEKVPGRIAALTDTDLTTTAVRPSPAERIRLDVQALGGIPRYIEDSISEAAVVLSEIDSLIKAAPPVSYTVLSRPTSVPLHQLPAHLRPAQADTAYNVHEPASAREVRPLLKILRGQPS